MMIGALPAFIRAPGWAALGGGGDMGVGQFGQRGKRVEADHVGVEEDLPPRTTRIGGRGHLVAVGGRAWPSPGATIDTRGAVDGFRDLAHLRQPFGAGIGLEMDALLPLMRLCESSGEQQGLPFQPLAIGDEEDVGIGHGSPRLYS